MFRTNNNSKDTKEDHISIGFAACEKLTKMLLNPVEDVHAHPAVHHVDGQTPLAKSTRAADPVQVRLVVWVAILVYWQVKVDHHRDLFHIDTCMCKTGNR